MRKGEIKTVALLLTAVAIGTFGYLLVRNAASTRLLPTSTSPVISPVTPAMIAATGSQITSPLTPPPPQITPEGSGIYGTVVMLFDCPAPTTNPPQSGCAETAPYRAAVIARTWKGRIVATFESDNNGKFRVALAPGKYILEPLNQKDSGPFIVNPAVEVLAGQYTGATIQYSTRFDSPPSPPPANNQANRDCGKSTFIVIAGGPSGPYGEAANARAREYFRANSLAIVEEGGSRFLIEPPSNSRDYWINKVRQDGIGSTQYDNVGCDWVR